MQFGNLVAIALHNRFVGTVTQVSRDKMQEGIFVDVRLAFDGGRVAVILDVEPANARFHRLIFVKHLSG